MTKLDIEKIYINHFLDFLKQENIYNSVLFTNYYSKHTEHDFWEPKYRKWCKFVVK